MVADPTSNQGDAGSIPTHGIYMFFSFKKDQLVVRCIVVSWDVVAMFPNIDNVLGIN